MKELYTWPELIEKFQWNISKIKPQSERIQYAKARGIILEAQERDVNKKQPRWKYKIIKQIEIYTRQQIIEKYGLQISDCTAGTAPFIRYCKNRGIIIERLGTVGVASTFQIIDDTNFIKSNEIWKPVKGTCLIVSNLGRVKNLSGQIKAQREIQGYMYVTDGVNNKHWRVHRLVLIAFNPIDNYEEFDIDHINGIRTDNRVENLRWVSTKKNIELRNLHQNQIGALVSELVQKYGYDDIYMYLLNYKKKGE